MFITVDPRDMDLSMSRPKAAKGKFMDVTAPSIISDENLEGVVIKKLCFF